MLRKLSGRFVLFGILSTWVVGGAVAAVGCHLIDRFLRAEIGVRLKDDVHAGVRLLTEGGVPLSSSIEVHPDDVAPSLRTAVRILLEEASGPTGHAAGLLIWEDHGLCLVRANSGSGRLQFHPLRGANAVPDTIRSVVLASSAGEGAAGEVTVFEGPRRIATNVRTAEGVRAVGTMVSDSVARRVLDQGEAWVGRAYVVDGWRLTCYVPLRAPDGSIVGMLYAGLDEGPHVLRIRRSLTTFLGLILGITLLVSLLAATLGRRLARPLTQLAASSRALAGGNPRHIDTPPRSAAEVHQLTMAFNTMVDEVTTRTLQLEASRGDALQALEDYMEVLAFVAHELKSPVAGSMSQLELLEEGYVGEVPEKMWPPIRAIRRYLDYALEMATSFNQLSRAESGGFTVRTAGVSSLRQALIDVCVEDQREAAARREMTIAVADADASGEIDADLLRIPLDNLLSNAIKYGRPGTAIAVELEMQGEVVRISVQNEGMGVRSGRWGELFQKFRRIRDPGIEAQKGTGTGLYLSRRLVELHGGRVGVAGEYGAWIRFWFEVPIRQPTEE